jgi:hypothetical protein
VKKKAATKTAREPTRKRPLAEDNDASQPPRKRAATHAKDEEDPEPPKKKATKNTDVKNRK